MENNNLTTVLNTELATQMAQPKFMELLQKLSAYDVQCANIKVTNDAEYQMCVDSLVAGAEVHKALEQMRKEIVAYPNAFVKTVNDTFRGLKNRWLRIRAKLEAPSVAYKKKVDAEYQAQQAAALAAQQETAQEPVEIGDDGAVTSTVQVPTPPLQTTKTVDGRGSVSYRKGPPKIEVVNAAKLVRAAISEKNKVPSEVISIDAKALRAAVDAGVYTIKQWAKYGVEVTETEQQVVRG